MQTELPPGTTQKISEERVIISQAWDSSSAVDLPLNIRIKSRYSEVTLQNPSRVEIHRINLTFFVPESFVIGFVQPGLQTLKIYANETGFPVSDDENAVPGPLLLERPVTFVAKGDNPFPKVPQNTMAMKGSMFYHNEKVDPPNFIASFITNNPSPELVFVLTDYTTYPRQFYVINSRDVATLQLDINIGFYH